MLLNTGDKCMFRVLIEWASGCRGGLYDPPTGEQSCH